MKKFLLMKMFFILSCISLKANCCFFADIEYLFWNVSQVNMPYAVAIEDINNFANFEEIRQEDHWTSGVRLALGTRLCCKFDTRLSWTRFHSKFRDSESVKTLIASELLAPNIGFIIGGDDVGGPASSQWTLNFDTFDWDFGMPIPCNEVLCIFPYIGLKASIIRQEQCITYENFRDTNTSARLDALIKEKNNFYGVGPKLGLSLSYLLCSKWHLDGIFGTSLLYGRQISPSTSSFSEPAVSLFYSSKFHTNKWRLIPFIQCFLGISWHKCLCNCFPMILGLGYEAQFFWDIWRTQNSIIQQVYITDASFGSLMLNGLTAKLEVSY